MKVQIYNVEGSKYFEFFLFIIFDDISSISIIVIFFNLFLRIVRKFCCKYDESFSVRMTYIS